MTPEGRVKNKVNKVLSKYPNVYKFMPVQTGFGRKTLDYLVCINGRFLAIETKAPGKKPTALQEQCIKELEAAGAVVFIIDDVSAVGPLEEWLDAIHDSACQ
jgi:hypothetical protein